MPFEAVQSKSMWVVLFMAVDHNKEVDLQTLSKVAGPDNVPSVRELDISPNEGIFLLTALSNMAIARDGDQDKDLIETIAVLIVEVGCLYINSFSHTCKETKQRVLHAPSLSQTIS